MKKTWQILTNEFISVVSRRSFIVTLLMVPLISGIIMLVVSVLGKDTQQMVGSLISAPVVAIHEGYVDHSGLIRLIPPEIPAGRLTAFSSEEAARQALLSGKISAYYIVPQDYIESGEISYVRQDFNPITGISQAEFFQTVLRFNLLGGNQELATRLGQPLVLNKVSLAPEPERDQNNLMTFFLPYGVTMLFYILIMTSAGLMLNSVTTEKQNRVIEILMASVTPLQMLVGKIVALGITGLLQTVVWSASGWILLRISGSSLSLPASFQLPTSILIWGAVFFLLGYAVYASLMAGVGALVPNLREASQATFIIIIPLIIPLIVISSLIENPHGTLSTVLSLFPLTSPVAMMTRLASGGVPFWQLLLAAGLLAGTAALTVRAVARMFRAQVLLSGQSFEIRRFFRALAGKAA